MCMSVFAYAYVSEPRMCLLHKKDRKGHQIPWDYSYM